MISAFTRSCSAASGTTISKREKRYVHKDGHTVWGSLTVSAVRDEDGTPRFIVGMVEDITERKRVEEDLRQRDAQLLQSQKMEAVGQLAGGRRPFTPDTLLKRVRAALQK